MTEKNPTLKEREAALEKLYASKATASAELPPGAIAKQRPGYHYCAAQANNTEIARQQRLALTEAGYEEATDGEFVVGCADMVVMRIPQSIYDRYIYPRVKAGRDRLAAAVGLVERHTPVHVV